MDKVGALKRDDELRGRARLPMRKAVRPKAAVFVQRSRAGARRRVRGPDPNLKHKHEQKVAEFQARQSAVVKWGAGWAPAAGRRIPPSALVAAITTSGSDLGVVVLNRADVSKSPALVLAATAADGGTWS